MVDVPQNSHLSFWDHLEDLRKLLIWSGGVYLFSFLCLLPFSKNLYEFLSTPLRLKLPSDAHMIATEVTTTFMVPMLLTAYTSLLIITPIIIWLVWNYLKSALYEHEKKRLLSFCFGILTLFYIGNIFAFYIVLPSALHFFILISPESVLPMTDIYSYFSFCIKLLLVFGIIFEIPIFVLILVIFNLIKIETLKEKRRFIIVGCFFIAMFITPPDALSMLMLAIPMCLLFELGLLLAKFASKTKFKLSNASL